MPAKVLRMSISVTGDPTRSAFAAALTERILVAVFLQSTWGDRVTWLGEYIPHSLSAARAYRQAWRYAELKYVREAAQLDTSWVEAAAFIASFDETPAGDSALSRLARRPGLLPSEREVVDFYLAERGRNPARVFELAMRRFRVNPEGWVTRAARWAEATDRSAQAVAVSNYVDSLVEIDAPRFIQAKSLGAFALHHLGRYREELAVAHEIEA